MHFWDRHKTIICCYETITHSVCDKYGLTQMEYDILMFLHNYPEYNTAADIVKIRKSTKSHVSTSLKLLEEKGLIEKKQNENNKKRIEIYLLDPAKAIVREGLNAQKEFAHGMLHGLTEDEISVCKTVFGKICNNAENKLKEMKENK